MRHRARLALLQPAPPQQRLVVVQVVVPVCLPLVLLVDEGVPGRVMGQVGNLK